MTIKYALKTAIGNLPKVQFLSELMARYELTLQVNERESYQEASDRYYAQFTYEEEVSCLFYEGMHHAHPIGNGASPSDAILDLKKSIVGQHLVLRDVDDNFLHEFKVPHTLQDEPVEAY